MYIKSNMKSIHMKLNKGSKLVMIFKVDNIACEDWKTIAETTIYKDT
jgi:hypothetical protein